jgi:hypothetical protein
MPTPRSPLPDSFYQRSFWALLAIFLGAGVDRAVSIVDARSIERQLQGQGATVDALARDTDRRLDAVEISLALIRSGPAPVAAQDVIDTTRCSAVNAEAIGEILAGRGSARDARAVEQCRAEILEIAARLQAALRLARQAP